MTLKMIEHKQRTMQQVWTMICFFLTQQNLNVGRMDGCYLGPVAVDFFMMPLSLWTRMKAQKYQVDNAILTLLL